MTPNGAATPPDRKIYCGARLGDYFELHGEMLKFPVTSAAIRRRSGSNWGALVLQQIARTFSQNSRGQRPVAGISPSRITG
jgi:hypothetical protein